MLRAFAKRKNNNKLNSLEERVERILERPVIWLTFFLIPIIAIPELFKLPQLWKSIFYWADMIIWALFYLELFIRLAVSRNYFKTLKKNWLLVVILIIPMFRLLRLVRVLRVLGIIRVLRLQGMVDGLKKRTRILVYNLEYAGGVFTVIIAVSAFVIWIVERQREGLDLSYGDAMWWAVVTITTVGYGDIVPISPEGKAFAAVLSVVGIVLFMILIAKVTSMFIINKVDSKQNEAIEKLINKIDRLEKKSKNPNSTGGPASF